MKVSIIATLCHIAMGQPPVCHNEIVFDADSIGIGCLIASASIYEWKAHSIYAGDNWQISHPRCAPGGGYVIREQT
jgi:hypothetical protein